jgi:hypothetical protein
VIGGYSGIANGAFPPAGYPVELTYTSSFGGAWVFSAINTPSLVARAWANFAAGTLGASANIATWTKSATGVYNFTFTSELATIGWGMTFGADGSASQGAFATNKALTGGTINGFNTTSGAAQDIDGTVVFWSS